MIGKKNGVFDSSSLNFHFLVGLYLQTLLVAGKAGYQNA